MGKDQYTASTVNNEFTNVNPVPPPTAVSSVNLAYPQYPAVTGASVEVPDNAAHPNPDATKLSYPDQYPAPPHVEVAQQSTMQPIQNSSTFISFPEVIEHSDAVILIKNMDFTEKTIRLAFVRKVYSIVMLQFLITGLMIFGCMQLIPLIGLYTRKHFWLVMGPALYVYLTTYLCIICFEGPRRKVPYNYIFLLLFTLSLSFMVGIVSTFYTFKEIYTAGGITFVVMLSLTLFAFQTKVDFTVLTGSCLCTLLPLTLLGITMLTTSYNRWTLVYITISIIIICIYIVFDTQMIVEGTHRYSISPEEYIFGALVLYIDVMYLFLRILRMIR